MATTNLTAFDVTRKRTTLYLVIVVIWFLILFGFVPSLWRTFVGLDSLLAKILFIPLAGCLALFWFYGVYYSVFLVFSYLGRINLVAKAQTLAKEMSLFTQPITTSIEGQL